MVEKAQIGDCTLYCGDSLEILPDVGTIDAVITDPIWPNAPEGMFAEEYDRDELLASALGLCPSAKRVVIVLRYDSDPRFLAGVPAQWPFFRVCHLRYALPSRFGRTLGGMELAYVFGNAIKSAKGRHIVPGMTAPSQPGENAKNGHPCPRPLSHTLWLVNWYSDAQEIVADPFMGSGTTGVAAAKLGRKFVGVEIEPRYFDIACRRIEAAYAEPRLFSDVRQEQAEAAEPSLFAAV